MLYQPRRPLLFALLATLSTLLLAALLLAQSAQAAGTLLGHWSIEEGSGSTIADSSGNGYDGTVSGSPTWTSSAAPALPISSYALSFANGDGAQVPYNAAFDVGSVTVSAWIKPAWVSGNPGYQPTIFAMRDSGGTRWSVHVHNNYSSIDLWNGSAYSMIPTTVTRNQWLHVTAVINSGNWSLYVNGSFVGSRPVGMTTALTGRPFDIGYNGSSEPFLGAIDEVQLYSGALTAGEIAPVAAACSSSVSVTNGDDSGSGSLREAVANVCTGGTISFADSYSIYLDSTLLLSRRMTINGSGQTVAVSGDSGNDGTANVRPFEVAATGVVTLTHVSVVSGTQSLGGGLYNAGTLSISDSTFSGNTATSNNGGAIYNVGSLTIASSTLSNNVASIGAGAILNAGTLSISDSSFSGNVATEYAGAIYNHNLATATISGSTLSANSATNAGGGIYAGGSVTLKQTIIANSTTGGDCIGNLATNSNNLIEDGSCLAAFSGDPLLSALGSYGGATQTFALLPGSKAIDLGDSTTCAASPVSGLDQRGTSRSAGTSCDLGAFESQGITIAITGGDNQSAGAGDVFSSPLAVQLTANSAGEPLGPGGKVTFTAPASGPSLMKTSQTVSTNASGAASLSATAGTITGSYTVSASVAGVTTPVSFSLQNTTATPKQLSVGIASVTQGSGSVSSSPAGISCSGPPQTGDCAETVAFGSVITLTATPATGSSLMSWSGGCSGYYCVPTLTSAHVVTATFQQRQLTLSDIHSCMLTASGNAQCWGSNGNGQAPTSVSGPFSQLSAGDDHTCALTTTGDAQCWGSNGYGQAPASVTGPFLQVEARWHHTCALKTTGDAQCWGSNDNGQAPTSVSGPFSQLSAGWYHTCALKTTGDAQCWGHNGYGQAPTSVSGPFSQLSAGLYHTCALTVDGDAQCWGYSGNGQAPASVTGPFSQLTVAIYHTCALQATGDAQCWGFNLHGQAPTSVSGPFSQLSITTNSSCAVQSDLRLRCWGYNLIGSPQLFISPGTLPELIVGNTYTQSLVLLSGGEVDTYTPITYTLSSGSLPPGLSLSSAGVLSGTPTTSGSFTFQIYAQDERGFYTTQSFSQLVLPHARPTANAGADQELFAGALVTLNGTGSNSPGGYTPLSYQWSQTSGTAVSLSSATAASPTFTAPSSAGTLKFSLNVTDDEGIAAASSDSVSIVVKTLQATNPGPTMPGYAITLTANQANDSPGTYSWDFGDGSDPGSGITVQHSYATAGTYTATVTLATTAGTFTATTKVLVTDRSTTPGGVVTGLNFWLKAGSGIASANGGAVTSWQDQSGRELTVTQAITTNQPTYQADQWNGHPLVRFDSSDYLTRTVQGSALFASDQATIFFVKHSTSNSGVWFKWETASSNRAGFEISSSKVRFDMPNDGTGKLTGNTIVTDRVHLITGLKTSSQEQIYLDGAQDASKSNGNTLNTSPSADLTIGKQTGGGLSWRGDQGEVIVYGRALSNAERVQVESYLALKYGLTLGSATAPISYTDSQGATIWAADSMYQRNVAGIGRDDLSGLDQRRSSSTISGDILSGAHGTLEAPTALPADRSFLIWGHDGASSTVAVTGTRTSGDPYTRLARSWRIQRGGSLDDVTLSFDLSGLAGSYNLQHAALLIDADGNFADATISTAGRALNGSSLSFQVSDLPATAYVTVMLTGPMTLTVASSGQGSITSAPEGVSCGSTCQASYASGTPITLTATPASGWRLQSWDGDCAGSGDTLECSLTMDQDRSVSASFCANNPTVTSAADSGAGTLRQSIADACDGDTITFAGDLSIYLSSPLEITRPLTIDGSGHAIVISGDWGNDGSADTRVFTVSGQGVTLTGLTITRGAASLAGAIHNTGTLTVANSLLSGNFSAGDGGAIANYSTLTIINSTISANKATTFGGGIVSHGSLTVSGSTIVSNTAISGGGIFVSSPATISNSTFATNSVTGYGGGFYANSTTALISHSTFSGNSANASGGALATPGSTTTLVNSILANSSAGGDCFASGQLSLTQTLIEDGSCSAALTGDPGLAPLGSYGGSTQTFALLPGSKALDAGNGADCTATDQRGVSRPQGSGCDLGAFESRGFTLSVVSGGGQSITPGSIFPSYLVVQLSALDSGVPVGAGHVITFTSPTGSAGFITPVITTMTALDGSASVRPEANEIEGSYVVTATALGVTSPATFTLSQYNQRQLSVARSGDGTGTVSSSPAGIDCGGDCDEALSYGTVITLTATPGAQASFAGWSGACSGLGSCTITMTATRGVTATFTTNQYALNVAIGGTGSGTVSSAPAGVNCTATCAAAFSFGTQVILSATPAAGSRFTGWSGDCSGTGLTCQVVMDQARSVTATFESHHSVFLPLIRR